MFPTGMAPVGNKINEWMYVGALGAASAENEFVWTKPPSASMIWMFIQNGGAGGAGGFTRASLAQGGGGGGGAGGSWARLIVPALLMPTQLIIRPSNGGLGGGAGAAGVGPSAGAITFLTSPAAALRTIGLCTAGTAPTAGTGAAGGAAGAANTINSQLTASWLSNVCISTTASGIAGTAGHATSSSTAVAISANAFGHGAAGGAGVTTGDVVGQGAAGGAQSATGTGSLRPVGATPAGAGNNGIHGLTFMNGGLLPSSASGANGGNSGGTVAGGRGGDGGWGCGGGGGGAGTTGGSGGNGGPGFVYIVAW